MAALREQLCKVLGCSPRRVTDGGGGFGRLLPGGDGDVQKGASS